MARIIGIRHRVKKTRDGEARPTMLAISDGDRVVTHELEDETAELDFLLHRFPIAWCGVDPGEDISTILGEQKQWLYHCKTRKRSEDESVEGRHPSQVIEVDKITLLVIMVPTAYEGLQQCDTVASVLGGSGDRFNFALSRRAEELDRDPLANAVDRATSEFDSSGTGVGTRILRLTPALLKQHRGDASKDDDHLLLARLVVELPDLFYEVRIRDRKYIKARATMRARRYVQKDRIKCEQRLIQRAQDVIFLSEEGRYPEGRIDDQYDALKANDTVFQALKDEEKAREVELRRAVSVLDVWTAVFEPIEGCGEVLAAGIITAIGDIRRFWVPRNPDDDRPSRTARIRGASRLKAYLGAHVLSGGKYADVPPEQQFPRNRSDAVGKCSWQREGRQALYLLADQFVKRPGSVWGVKQRGFKAALRLRHPSVVVNEKGKKRYTNGHIHKMSIWRTLTRFVEHLFIQWTALERAREPVNP